MLTSGLTLSHIIHYGMRNPAIFDPKSTAYAQKNLEILYDKTYTTGIFLHLCATAAFLQGLLWWILLQLSTLALWPLTLNLVDYGSVRTMHVLLIHLIGFQALWTVPVLSKTPQYGSDSLFGILSVSSQPPLSATHQVCQHEIVWIQPQSTVFIALSPGIV